MNLLFAGVIICVIALELYGSYLAFTEEEYSPTQTIFALTHLSVVCIALANLLAVVLK